MTFPRIVPDESYRGEVLGIGLTVEEAHHLLAVLSDAAWRGDGSPATHAFAVELHDRVATWLRAHNRRRDLAREDMSREPAP